MQRTHAWHYEFALDPGLARVHGSVCFDGPLPVRLVAGGDAAYGALERVEAREHGRVTVLRADADGIPTAGLAPGACIAYTSRLELPDDTLGALGLRTADGRGLVASTRVWLWYPDRYVSNPDVSATVSVPAGSFASLPWAHDGHGGYRLDATVFQREGFLAVGPEAPRTVAGAGGAIEVIGLRPPRGANREEIDAWIASSAVTEASLSGARPARAGLIVTLGVPVAGDAVPFAFTSHAGLDAVFVLLGADVTRDAIEHDDTLVHEFVHWNHPVLRDTDVWIGEGLATYYQTVLWARAGRIAERDAWQVFHDGFGRGRADRTGRTLAEDSAAYAYDHHYGRVYWAGVAFALLGDVALREQSRGTASLDDAMGLLRALHENDRARTWSADEFARAMDAPGGRDVFAPLARRLASASEFPALGDAYAQLGLRVSPDGLRIVDLDDEAPMAHVRRAIMRGGVVGPAGG